MTITNRQRALIRGEVNSFLQRRYANVQGLRLAHLNINPFVARSLATHLGIQDPRALISFFVRQRVERGIVTAMGTLLQKIATLFADRTGVEGADIQVDRDRRYYVELPLFVLHHFRALLEPPP
ncbi:hypothetical protein CMI37_36705 [Candidatus Pacearchaeota archaeon]|nr:hypothetical protein [Candidatus Pacearchaeota archaeon]|tara:strand:+ start:4857 stop:5228 length:372 start_codon:yes stop_codon:yes gene_type:complete